MFSWVRGFLFLRRPLKRFATSSETSSPRLFAASVRSVFAFSQRSCLAQTRTRSNARRRSCNDLHSWSHLSALLVLLLVLNSHSFSTFRSQLRFVPTSCFRASRLTLQIVRSYS